MRTFVPRPAGLEAPEALPRSATAVSAEATGLGGTDSVQLIATPTAEPVNSPGLAKAAANPASDLGSFSTTAAGSASVAASHVAAQADDLVASCNGKSSELAVGPVQAVSCPSAQGQLVNFNYGNWLVQVQDFGGDQPPQDAATTVASWLRANGLPPAGKGLVLLSVPAGAQEGSTTTCQLLWSQGEDDYQVNGRGSIVAALRLAADLRPWPGG